MKTERQFIIKTMITPPVSLSRLSSHPPTLASPEPETNVYPEVIQPVLGASNLNNNNNESLHLQLNTPFLNRETGSLCLNESEGTGHGLTLYKDDSLVPATGPSARPGPLQVSEWSQSVSGLQTRASSVTSSGHPPGTDIALSR